MTKFICTVSEFTHAENSLSGRLLGYMVRRVDEQFSSSSACVVLLCGQILAELSGGVGVLLCMGVAV